ncbi:MAG: DNA polymerase III subunit alpha, partial [Prolixibacteraceae bacterium]|nr:DNA polymerase III subunit alpha [Prolixibacteraceae bacterium]
MYLNSHTYYSLRYGTLSVDKLLELSVRNKAEVMALTDINTSAGIPEFIKKAKKYGIKPLAGIEFRNGDQLMFIGIACNNDGFKELNDYLTEHNLSKKEFRYNEWIFNNVLILYPFGYKNPAYLKDYEYIGILPSQVNLLFTSSYRKYQRKLVILNTVTFENTQDYILHRSLRAIDHNTLISKLKTGQFALQDEYMLSVSKLEQIFKEYPEIIQNTRKISESCFIDFDYNSVKNKKTFTKSDYEDKLLLEKLAMEGMSDRYGNNNDIALKRIRYELKIIDKLRFSSYFLIAWDIIRYSMSRGIYHVGRGSGANSIVAYCLKITEVDPLALNLYFERFLNVKRSEPPDFDIDYSWKDRDEVLKYIFRCYGKNHVALLGAMSTFKSKSVFRELGKVFGLPRAEIDRMIRDPLDENNNNKIVEKIISLGRLMSGFPNQRTIHSGGILISEKPLTCYTSLDLSKKGFPTTHLDMYTASDIRFAKLDILSQRGLGHIHDAVEIVKKNRGVNINIHRVQEFFNDEKIKNLLRKGEVNGCFYIESPGMRRLLRKLRCDNYLSLVAASSIIRPGVAKSGMMREYIRRFHHPRDFKYIHPVMKEQLSETYGIMVYQEDVMKVAHHFAGLDLTDADVLRRAISGKYRSPEPFMEIEKKYFENCRKRGYQLSVVNEVWRHIKSFAGYSFCKAHSASYAVESFQSLYLKAHYPLEFQVAVIN